MPGALPTALRHACPGHCSVCARRNARTDVRTDLRTRLSIQIDISPNASCAKTAQICIEVGPGQKTVWPNSSWSRPPEPLVLGISSLPSISWEGVFAQGYAASPQPNSKMRTARNNSADPSGTSSSALRRHHEADPETFQSRPCWRPRRLRSSANVLGETLHATAQILDLRGGCGQAGSGTVLWQTGVGNGQGNTDWTKRVGSRGFMACSPIARWRGKSDGSDPLCPPDGSAANRLKQCDCVCTSDSTALRPISRGSRHANLTPSIVENPHLYNVIRARINRHLRGQR